MPKFSYIIKLHRISAPIYQPTPLYYKFPRPQFISPNLAAFLLVQAGKLQRRAASLHRLKCNHKRNFPFRNAVALTLTCSQFTESHSSGAESSTDICKYVKLC